MIYQAGLGVGLIFKVTSSGIYLLVADNGDQYVGSATGDEGVIGIWSSYFYTGMVLIFS